MPITQSRLSALLSAAEHFLSTIDTARAHAAQALDKAGLTGPEGSRRQETPTPEPFNPSDYAILQLLGTLDSIYDLTARRTALATLITERQHFNLTHSRNTRRRHKWAQGARTLSSPSEPNTSPEGTS